MSERNKFDTTKVQWEGEAYKFGFTIALMKSKRTLWNKRYFKLYFDRLEYFTSNPDQGGKLKGCMTFTTTTYAQEELNGLPVTAHAEGFAHVAAGNDPSTYTSTPVDIGDHFDHIISVNNCLFANHDNLESGRAFLMAWDDKTGGRPAMSKVTDLLNKWLPCDDNDPDKLPRELFPTLGPDKPAVAASAESKQQVSPRAAGAPPTAVAGSVVSPRSKPGGVARLDTAMVLKGVNTEGGSARRPSRDLFNAMDLPGIQE